MIELPTEPGAVFWAERDGREEMFVTYSAGGDDCLYEGRGGVNGPHEMRTLWTITRAERAK